MNKQIQKDKDEVVTFGLGSIVTTRGVYALMQEFNFRKAQEELLLLLTDRYVQNDWGNLLCDEDKLQNDYAVRNDERIVAKYVFCGRMVYVITEWDRSATTILFPEEY